MRYQREIERANERVTLLTALSHDVMFDIDCQGQTGEVFGDFNARIYADAGRPEDMPAALRILD